MVELSHMKPSKWNSEDYDIIDVQLVPRVRGTLEFDTVWDTTQAFLHG